MIPVAADIPDDPALARRIAGFKKDVDHGYLAAFGYRYDQIVAESGFDMETLNRLRQPGEAGIGNMITDAYREAVRRAEGPRYDHIHVALEPIGHIRLPS